LTITEDNIDLVGAVDVSSFFDMGTMDVGIPVTTADQFAMEVHTEPLTTLTAGDTGLSAGIRSRYHVTVAQPNQISISAVEARLRVKHGLADGGHSAVSGVIEASGTDADFTGTATTQRSAGFFALDFDSDVTLANDGWLTGVTINSSVDGGVDMSATKFAGLRLSTNAGKEVWEQGIVIDDSAAAIGLDIGTCTTAIAIADDAPIVLGTTTATAETVVTMEFDETTTGVGSYIMGSSGVPQVLNTNPGAAVIPFSINILQSAGDGDCDDLIAAYIKSQVTGDGDTGLTAVGAAPRFTVGTNGGTTAISQGYATQSHFIHRGTGTITAGSAGSFKTVLGVDDFTIATSLNALQAILEGESGTPTITGQLDVAWLHAESSAYGVDSILRMSNTNSATAGIDMSGVVATDDVIFQNGETLDNATDGFLDAEAGLLSYSQSVVLNSRHRVTTAEINSGHEVLPAITGRAYRLISVKAIAYGGAVGATTTVDVLGTQSAGGVKLVTFAQADLVQSAILTDAADGTVLADGASFAACDAATAITVGKTDSDVTTATGVDFIITYVIE